MDENRKALRTMLIVIKKFVVDLLQRTHFIAMKQGTITKVLGDNKYSVTIMGAAYTVPCPTNQTFNAGDRVIIFHDQSDFTKKYIFGRG